MTNLISYMQKFKKNSNKINGLTIRQSDMSYELKTEITEVISKALQIPEMDEERVSKIITDFLNKKYPNGWICLIGKKFLANISHEPKHFIRLSTEQNNFLIYKCE